MLDIKLSKKMIKNQKNAPINKELIIDCKYYVPFYVNEKEWKRVDFTYYLNILKCPKWFNVLEYDYKINEKNNKYCSIDIGCKNFITLYGLDGKCIKIKSNYEVIDKILKSKRLSNENKDKRIKELINNLHIASANYICQQYDVIYVGLVSNKGNIDSKSMKSIEDNLLKIVSHKEFLETLRYYTYIYNKELRVVEESFTSVQCGVCGEKNKFTRIYEIDDSERRKYTCIYCNGEFCRDLNASRNILIKNENKFN